MEHQIAGEDPIGHETTDVSTRPIVLIALGSTAVCLAFIGAMYVMVDWSASQQALHSPKANPLAATFARKEPPEPRLQTHPLNDLKSLRTHESQVLGSYGWVDRNAGVVRIPIDRAKELLVKRGAGAFSGGAGQ
jgi:hypothetical protein